MNAPTFDPELAMVEWDSPRGKRSVVGTRDGGGLLIATEGFPGAEIIKKESLAEEIGRDAANVAYRERARLATAKRKSEEEAKDDLGGFGSDMTPPNRARALKILQTHVSYDGEIMRRMDYIQRAVHRGSKAGAVSEKSALMHPKGSYTLVTKTEIDYALHIEETAR